MVHPNSSLKCMNCYFECRQGAILISMKAYEVNVQNSYFKDIVNIHNKKQHIGCIVIQDHWETPYVNFPIVNLYASNNKFDINKNKFPFIEITCTIPDKFKLYDNASYNLTKNIIHNNFESTLNANILYTSKSSTQYL